MPGGEYKQLPSASQLRLPVISINDDILGVLDELLSFLSL